MTNDLLSSLREDGFKFVSATKARLATLGKDFGDEEVDIVNKIEKLNELLLEYNEIGDISEMEELTYLYIYRLSDWDILYLKFYFR